MKQYRPEWTKQQFDLQKQATDLLIKIKDETFEYIFNNPDLGEYEVQQFLIDKFNRNNLVIDKNSPLIVGFGPDAAFPHYFPTKETSRKLKPDTLILIDIWSKININEAPFSDMTWMGFYGKVPNKVSKVYSLVIESRDKGISYIEKQLKLGNLPSGQAVDKVCRDAIDRVGFGLNFIHSTGHSIGFTSPHGIWGGLRKSNHNPLVRNLGYTIEPGIYLKDEFGVRSEINFYINDKYQFVLTTPVQKDLIIGS